MGWEKIALNIVETLVCLVIMEFNRMTIDSVNNCIAYDTASERVLYSMNNDGTLNEDVQTKWSESQNILYDNTLYFVEKMLQTKIYTDEILWFLCNVGFETDIEQVLQRGTEYPFGIVHNIKTQSARINVPDYFNRDVLKTKTINLSYCDHDEIDKFIFSAQCNWQHHRLSYRYGIYKKVNILEDE